MAINLKPIIESIGKNNKPTYAVMAVAVANGIFKPLTSLTDKNESPETKNYAALREFLTEVVAVPTYWVSGEIASKIAGKAFQKEPLKQPMAKTNLGFVGVCIAALFIIPALCSVIVKPFTDLIYKHKNNVPSQPNVTDIKLNSNIPYNKGANTPKINSPYSKYSMEIFMNRGGLKI